jgi:hypothetical protein
VPYFSKPFVTFLVFALLLPAHGMAQESDEAPKPPKPPKLFASDEILNIRLQGPWRRISRNASSPERFAGSIEYTDAGGNKASFPVGITTRGLTRRDRVCDFPPLKLWFDKEQVKGTVFRGQGSLKMVTYCQLKPSFQQYNVTEYLAYRIYNLITPYSFRARAMMVDYQDSERDGDPVTRFGFLIEDIDDVARRNDLVELEIPEVSKRRLDPDQTGNYMLFQFLIGNLDWSPLSGPDPVECCHNSKLIGTGPEDSPVFPIPYDLDSTGLVNAHYAAPPAILRVKRITQRLYRGFCLHNEALPAAMDRYRAQKEAILDLFLNESLLTKRIRGRAIKYVEDFYRLLDNPDQVEKQITGKCRQ